MNFRENPYIYMFYAPRKDEDELHVPDCDDFVVFYVKKSKALKAYRIFQCHCQQKVYETANKRVPSINTNIKKRKTPSNFTNLGKMIEDGCFSSVLEAANFTNLSKENENENRE